MKLNQSHKATDTRRIVMLAMPPVREIDLIGPADAFSTANRLCGGAPLYDVRVVRAAVGGGGIAGMSGIHFVAHEDCSSFDEPIDTLLVPGGMGCEEGVPEEESLEWLRNAAVRSRRVGSICTGAFLLAQAGLLDGRRVTTHWSFAERFKATFPNVRLDPVPIWIRDGNVYTSAGVTSGIDLSLALIEEDHGAALALEVARDLVVFLKRPGNQAQFSVALRSQAGEKSALHELAVWMAENLSADLSVPVLAERAGMSTRNFQRVFTKTMEKPPAAMVEELRVEAARRQIERSGKSMEEIAAACGLGSADAMRRSFIKLLYLSPNEYRRRFHTSGITEG